MAYKRYLGACMWVSPAWLEGGTGTQTITHTSPFSTLPHRFNELTEWRWGQNLGIRMWVVPLIQKLVQLVQTGETHICTQTCVPFINLLIQRQKPKKYLSINRLYILPFYSFLSSPIQWVSSASHGLILGFVFIEAHIKDALYLLRHSPNSKPNTLFRLAVV